MEVLIPAGAAFLGAVASIAAAIYMGVGKAQDRLVDTLKDTISAQQDRIGTLESDLRDERKRRELLEHEKNQLEKRVTDLERAIADLAIRRDTTRTQTETATAREDGTIA